MFGRKKPVIAVAVREVRPGVFKTRTIRDIREVNQ